MNFSDLQLGVMTTAATATDLIAVRFFSPQTNYAVDDMVVQAGDIWSALVAVTPGPFNPAQWNPNLMQDDAGGLLAGYLPLTGGTLTGPLVLPANAVAALQAVPLQQVLPLTGGTLTGPLIGTAATFAGPLNGAAATFTGSLNGVAATFTGPLNIDLPAVPATASYPRINGAAGTERALIGTTAGVDRWGVVMGTSSTETGAAAGSDFAIARYDDTGTYIDVPLLIDRATGLVTIDDNTLIYWDATLGAVFQNLNTAEYVAIDNGTSFNCSLPDANKPNGGMWGTFASDARVKTVLGDYALGLDEVLQLRPVSYVFKGNDTPTADINKRSGAPPDDPMTMEVKVAPYPGSPHYGVATAETPFVGFIAQEVEQIFPSMVTQKNGFIDGQPVNDLRTLNASELIFALVNAVKTLATRVEALEGGP